MELLRNLGETTRILILLEISLRNHSVQRTIGEALGMTAQGVSEYLRTMQADGLVHIVDGEYRPTFEGVRVLHQRFRDLREFVDGGSKGLSIIEGTAAVAGSAIERGETVGLFMERGDLVAYAGRASPSRGRAITAADRGQDVGVAQLEGIVALKPGHISLLRIPSAADGGSRRVDPARARKVLRRIDATVVATLDPPAKALAAKLRVRPDIRFGAIPASIEAAERGLDVALILPEDRVASAVTAIEGANERLGEKIPYETLSLA